MALAAVQVPNFVGAKFTSKDCGEAGNCLRLRRPNGKPFLFFFGSDEVIVEIKVANLKNLLYRWYTGILIGKMILPVQQPIIQLFETIHGKITSWR